jgi:hypothetical protein
MWADEDEYKKEQKDIKSIMKQKQKLLRKVKLGAKKRIKFTLFLISANLFCLAHKCAHKL